MMCVDFFSFFFFFKQKTAYEMRISDWSSDVCSSDLPAVGQVGGGVTHFPVMSLSPSGLALRHSHISLAHTGRHPGQASVSEREPGPMAGPEIGRASGRGRVGQSV